MGAGGAVQLPQTSFPGESALSREDARQAAGLFSALGDPSRVLVVLALRVFGELCVEDLADAVALSAPAVSHHLNILRRQHFVLSRQSGRRVFYKVDDQRVRASVVDALSYMGVGDMRVSRSDRPLRIGSAMPISGFAAADGLEQKRAASLAIEQWNSRGGVLGRLIEHVVVDVGDMSPKRMVYAFKTLIEEYQVDAIVNGYLLYTGEEHELVRQTCTPYVHTNTSSANQALYGADPKRFWMCFQCDPSEKLYGTGFPHFLQFLEHSGVFRPRQRNLAVVAGTDPYSASIALTLRESVGRIGWRVSLFEQVVTPCERWEGVLKRIRAVRPDVVFVSDIVLGDNITFVEAFLANPTPSLVYGQYSPTLQEYLDTLGAAAEGTITSTVGGVLPGSLGEQYVSDYAHRWGVHPGASIGGLLYDDTNLYLMAASLAGGPENREAVCRYLIGLWIRGTTGVCHFSRARVVPSYPTQTRDASAGMPHLFFQVQKGRRRIVFPPPYADCAFVLPPWYEH